jgi:hypothetical protein
MVREYLNEHLPGSCAALVFHIGEVGVYEWQDRASRKAIVSILMTDQPICHGIPRNIKHISVICCVSAAGESLMPFMASSHFNYKLIKQPKNE